MVNVGSCTSRKIENQVPVSTSDLMNLPTGFLDFPTFKEKFSLGGASTERICEITKSLSQSCYRNSIEGLKLLSAVDDHVIQGLEDFNPIIHELAPLFADKIERGGEGFSCRIWLQRSCGIRFGREMQASFPWLRLSGPRNHSRGRYCIDTS